MACMAGTTERGHQFVGVARGVAALVQVHAAAAQCEGGGRVDAHGSAAAGFQRIRPGPAQLVARHGLAQRIAGVLHQVERTVLRMYQEAVEDAGQRVQCGPGEGGEQRREVAQLQQAEGSCGAGLLRKAHEAETMPQFVQGHAHQVLLSGRCGAIGAEVPIGLAVQEHIDVVLAGVQLRGRDGVGQCGGVPGVRYRSAGEVASAVGEGDAEGGVAHGHPVHQHLDGNGGDQDAFPDAGGMRDGGLRLGRGQVVAELDLRRSRRQ